MSALKSFMTAGKNASRNHSLLYRLTHQECATTRGLYRRPRKNIWIEKPKLRAFREGISLSPGTKSVLEKVHASKATDPCS